MNIEQALATLDATDDRLFARPVTMTGTGFGYFAHDGQLHFRPGTQKDNEGNVTKLVPSIKEMLGEWEVVAEVEQ